MDKINLHGSWELLLDEEQQGIKEHFYKSETPFPKQIQLPTTISEAKLTPRRDLTSTDHLTDPYAFEGFAWYRKTVFLPNNCKDYDWELYLERTRMTQLYINGVEAGSFDSLCTPHCYPVTPWIKSGENQLVILVKNTGYPTNGGHMTSPDTQTNWNGLLGTLELRPLPRERILSLRLYPSFSGQSLTVRGRITPCAGKLELLIQDAGENIIIRTFHQTENSGFECRIPLENKLLPWSEYNPVLYQLKAVLYSGGTAADECSQSFGIRDFEAGKHHFLVNGDPVFLRGKHDGMIFPLTGYAPMNTEEWLKVMGTAKDYGINHYRFHTCCPPEAAFQAADQLGIYLEPELPFWGTVTSPSQEGHNEELQQYLITEGFRILDTFGNHPSFVMFSLGNELWGSKEVLNDILKAYKAHDKRHLYVQGSNNFQFTPCILPEDDFFSGVRFGRDRLIRGSYAMCDAPLGHIQTQRPSTAGSYDPVICPDCASAQTTPSENATRQIQYGTGVKEVCLGETEELIPDIPVISHEIGQYETFPDFSEIDRYTGVLQPENLRIFRKRLEAAGLADFAADYFYSSGRLAAACYKEELECALRSRLLAGYQLLDLQDFSGQGTALVGILNAFMENNGIIRRECWNQFCAPTVIMASFQDYTVQSKSLVPCKFLVSNYGPAPLEQAELTFSLSSKSDGSSCGDRIFYKETVPAAEIPRGLSTLAEAILPMPETKAPCRVALKLQLEYAGTGTPSLNISNEYTFWVYPAEVPAIPEDIHIIRDKAALKKILQQTEENAASIKKVLFLPSFQANAHSIEGTYCTDFWCYPMFRKISESMGKPVPVGTLGLFIREDHPALADFPCTRYSTPQWWDIVMNSRSTILDRTDIVPIVQTIDNFERNHRLGLVYEVYCNNCHIITCTADLTALTDSLPAKWLLESLTARLEKSGMKSVQDVHSSPLEIPTVSEETLLSLFTE